MDILPRHMEGRILEALDTFRVVVVHGARQCGKSTLARLIANLRSGTYVTLDDDAVRAAALGDPRTFLTSQRFPLAVDEIQLGGDRLVRTIKQLVDEDPTPGRYLLTGSTNFLTVPTISESLAGRARIMRLWPLTEAELAETEPQVDTWFTQPPATAAANNLDRYEYLERVCRGGYPELRSMAAASRRAWIESYLETVTQRDIMALADIRKSAELPRLFRWAAARTGQELNLTNAARDLGLTRATVLGYLEWLESVFLVHQVPAWSRNLSGRAIRRTKLHITDTALAADALDATAQTLVPTTAAATGPLLESFVINEIARQLSTSAARVTLSHYRDNRQREIDAVLERGDGSVVAVEVKSTTSPTLDQLRHVEWLRNKLDVVTPGAFVAGILLHTGTQSLTVGDRLHLAPISSLWSPGSAAT